MQHLGDITKIKGNEVPVVDVVIGGSPCQDLSLAGKRAGLQGARSGLYMEQIRIIKEMRQANAERGNTDVDIQPRYMVWENVPGAFSTNKGKDFAAVIEEAIRVAEPEAPDVHVPEKGWPTAGCFMGDKWSVAWRVLDAQFWGTSDKPLPQRRRRIALIADFGGHSAPEILFVRKSVSGNLEPGKPKRKATAGDVGEGTGGAVPCTLKIRGGCEGGGKGALIQENKSATLSTLQDQPLFQPIIGFQRQLGGAEYQENSAPTLLATAGQSGNNKPCIVQPLCIEMTSTKNTIIDNGVCPTLTARMGTGGNQVNAIFENAICMDVGFFSSYKEQSPTLLARSYKDPHLVVAGVDSRNGTELPNMNGTLQNAAAHNINSNNVVRVDHVVRRLTPLECERLQGFPDGWTDIGEWVDSNGKKRKPSDSPRYKALGNSREQGTPKSLLFRLSSVCHPHRYDGDVSCLFVQ